MPYRMPILSNTDMQLYCAIKSVQLGVVCKTKQWSGISEGNVSEWLHYNFKEITGRYLATKILLHSLFYSEDNIVELLRYGLYDRILGKEIKENLILTSTPYQSKTVIEAEINSAVKRTLFVPLLDNDKPSESGNAISRLLSQKLQIPNSNIYFPFLVMSNHLDSIDKIIIVDDCIGSGDQIDNFWNNKFATIAEEAKKRGIACYYLALVANENAVIELQLNGRLLGLRVIICEALNDEHRIFSGKHIIWNDQEELDLANNYFDLVESSKGIPKFGYGNLDFALFLHNTTPDWSLPIFWMENSQWKALIKRKNSQV